VTSEADSAAHWDGAYASGDTSRSWFQQYPRMSLQMFDDVGICNRDSVLDVGGGASTLVDALLGRGYDDVTVLDISATGMKHAQQRLGVDAARVTWQVADVLTWRPPRRYHVWHDRAVFHFLTAEPSQQRYLDTLSAATAAGAVAVFGCFAADGPQQCSGLPVARYDAQQLHTRLGDGWALISQAREEHHTPGGAVQSFTWAAFRRQ